MSKLDILRYEYMIPATVGISSRYDFEQKLAKAFKSLGLVLKLVKRVNKRDASVLLEKEDRFLGAVVAGQEKIQTSEFEKAVEDSCSFVERIPKFD